MDRIAGLFSPPLLAVLCGLAVATAAMLFVLSRRGEGATLDLRGPLSWSEPVEIRLILYLLVAAACGAGALILRLFVALVASGSVIGWLLLTLVFLGFVGNLAFFYAAAGCLLQAALGSRGRPPFWFSPLLWWLDGAVMDAGDILARILISPAPIGERRREPARQRRPDDYFDRGYEDEVLMRRPARSTSTSRPIPRRPDYADDDLGDESLPPMGDEPAPRRGPGLRRAQPRDVLRERLDRAIEDYEASLTPTQLTRLRELRSLIESFRVYT